MGYLNSLGLWGALAAVGVAVPILIHLLYRKHRKQTNWAAMELLRRALVTRSGQVKLEDLLILAMRCLALLLVAAALWRPTLSSESAQWLGEKHVGIVVAVDASYSMNHGEHSRFEKAVAKAREVLSKAQEGDPVSLVLMSNRPQVLMRRKGYDAAHFADVLDAQKKPTPYRLSLERNIEQLDELVDELKTPVRECYLVTDAQELDWAALSDRGRDALERIAARASVFLIPVSTDGDDNLSLTRLSYASGTLRASGVARFNAEVRNQGRRPTDGGTIEFLVEDELITRRAVGSLEAGETRAISFFTSFDNAGDIRLRARLAKDELPDDNQRFAVVNVRQRVRVLCVDDNSADAERTGRTGADYAVLALRPKNRGEADVPLQVHQIASADLSLETLTEFDVILLANVADLAPEMVKRLEGFVRRGGGLIMFLGDRVEADLYNQRFNGGPARLLPGRLVKTLENDPEQAGWVIAPVKSDHPLAAIVKQLPNSVVDKARFSKVMQVEPGQGSQTILTISESNAPLLLSRSIGGGTVLMFTTSADRSWNQLAVHPLLTILLQQAVTNLTSHPDARRVIVGEPAELSVPGREVGDQIRLTDPSGQSSDVNVTQAGQLPVCAIGTEQVGVYAIGGDANIPAVAVAVNVDSAESDVRVLDAGALSSQLSPLGVQVVAESKALARAIESNRSGRELADFLLISGIAIFLLQSFLSKYFTNRMSSGESNVNASLQISRVAAARRS